MSDSLYKGCSIPARLPFIDYGNAPLPVRRRTLRRGSSGADVRELQERLNQLGAALAEDGKFGKLTEAAVRMFQRENGLKADGICGERTSKKPYA